MVVQNPDYAPNDPDSTDEESVPVAETAPAENVIVTPQTAGSAGVSHPEEG